MGYWILEKKFWKYVKLFCILVSVGDFCFIWFNVDFIMGSIVNFLVWYCILVVSFSRDWKSVVIFRAVIVMLGINFLGWFVVSI